MKAAVFNLLFAPVFLMLLSGCKETGRIFYAEGGKDIYIGKIKEADGPVDFRIVIANNTGKILYPIEGRTSCRCISAEVDANPVVPGDEQVIQVTYNPAWREGRITERVYIGYAYGKFHEMTIVADVIPMKHPVEEEHPYDFGEDLHLSLKILHYGLMKPGATGDIYFHIANGNKRRADVEFVVGQEEYSPCIRMRQPGRMKADARDTIHVKFTMPEGASARDSFAIPLQPYVNGKKTEGKLTIMALALPAE